MSNEDTIKLILDPDNMPPMTAKRRALLARLDAMTDEDIDYSDAPKHDFERVPMHRVNPRAQPAPEPTEAGV